jgi:DNA-binding NarL/FixJ family response regulator
VLGFDASAEHRTLRVFVADDHPLVRDGLRLQIASAADLTIVGEASDGAETLDQLERLNGSVDVVLLDANMPVMDGVEAARQIASRFPAIRMVMLSGFAEPGTVREAVRIGVGGFLLKYQRTDHLLTAIRVVAGGGTIIDPVLAGSTEVADPHPADDEHVDLTERQLEVLQLVALGRTNQQIARRLQLSPNTVKRHVEQILRKLGMPDRASAVAVALRRRLIQ